MRQRMLLTIFVTALFVILSGCGTAPNCPTCGTTKNGAYAIINVVTVPEHNPTGEPGGPFNSFDISTIAPNPAASGHNLDYISDRIGLAIVVIDTGTDIAVDALQGSNAVTDAGNGRVPAIPAFHRLSRSWAISPGSVVETHPFTSTRASVPTVILADFPARSAALRAPMVSTQCPDLTAMPRLRTENFSSSEMAAPAS